MTRERQVRTRMRLLWQKFAKFGVWQIYLWALFPKRTASDKSLVTGTGTNMESRTGLLPPSVLVLMLLILIHCLIANRSNNRWLINRVRCLRSGTQRLSVKSEGPRFRFLLRSTRTSTIVTIDGGISFVRWEGKQTELRVSAMYTPKILIRNFIFISFLGGEGAWLIFMYLDGQVQAQETDSSGCRRVKLWNIKVPFRVQHTTNWTGHSQKTDYFADYPFVIMLNFGQYKIVIILLRVNYRK